MKLKDIIYSDDDHVPTSTPVLLRLTDDDLVGYGRYASKKLSEVPIWYLQWMVQQTNDYPRVQRPYRWTLIIEWIKSKA